MNTDKLKALLTSKNIEDNLLGLEYIKRAPLEDVRELITSQEYSSGPHIKYFSLAFGGSPIIQAPRYIKQKDYVLFYRRNHVMYTEELEVESHLKTWDFKEEKFLNLK